MLIQYGHDITISCPQETPLILMTECRDELRGNLRFPPPVLTVPAVSSRRYTDSFGNHCRRLVVPAGVFRISHDAFIQVDDRPEPEFPDLDQTPIDRLPDEVLIYLLGSRYCDTDQLGDLAWSLFGTTAPGWARVQAVCDYVHQHIRFDYNNARATRTASEAWHEGTGVCRDYAHLAIALLRCLNFPARYTNSYLGDIGVPPVDAAMDFAACIEVWMAGNWHVFDPRNNARRIGRIRVACGRDAADVPLIHSFGPHVLQNFAVWTEEVRAAA